ncbi:hypothetical protein B0F90DRAFT_1778905 [Multifurca ochricompacta]|uniref:Uncharacterized protein n=1 Tax=Multifurca ochricompacta TaxID=376703 RepID=A0AAD4QHM5_9AGAM|nr:hypothetical protein B0F90DRAFT_1778905 [Multifurca ochricompacta]
MSSMIVEQRMLLPDPRFPRIHNKELFIFHSLKERPSVNHVAVPPWCVSLAVL